MATLRDIKRRIVGVKNTQKITGAMKMVAAARLRRAQENMINARPYARGIASMLNRLLNVEKNFTHPLLEEREVKKVAVILVTSDRGLCGGFNGNVIKETLTLLNGDLKSFYDSGNLDLICIGKKGRDFFSSRDINIAESYPDIFSSKLKFEFVSSFMAGIINKFKSSKYDRIYLVYNQFKSVAQQVIKSEQILPLKTHEVETDSVTENTSVDYIYEPDKSGIITSLIPQELNAQMWKVLLESYAAELGARMTAMDMATENAKELIRTLQITYNKERQAAITNEILEIVSGANALQDA